MGELAVLEILSPGPLTTVQDLGRFGYARFGVPPSGALDAFSLRAANLLVGNPPWAAGLEMTFMGMQARVLAEVCVAITGADLGAKVNGKTMSRWRAHRLRPGDLLSAGMAQEGCRAYLAVGGGIAVPEVLGSRSTNLSSGFGGLEGRPLRKGDILMAEDPERHLHAEGRSLEEASVPRYPRQWRLHVLWGPQEGDFSPEVRTRFVESPFKVRPESDRTGLRLEGPVLRPLEGLPESILSEAVVAGAVQVPADGQPIVLLNETVTGGYRKIATLVAADLWKPAQMRPGDQVRFEVISLEEARRALLRQEALLAQLTRNTA